MQVPNSVPENEVPPQGYPQNQYGGPGGPPPPNSTQSLPRGGRLNSQVNYGNEPRQNRQVMRRDVPPNGSLDRGQRPHDMPERNNYNGPVDNFGRPVRPDQHRMPTDELKHEMERRRAESDPTRGPPGRDGFRPDPRDPRGPPGPRGPDSRGHDPRGPPDPRGFDPRDPRAHDSRGPPRGPDHRGPDPRGPDHRGPDGRGPDPRGPDGRGPDPRGPRGGPPDPRQDPRYRGEPPRGDPRYEINLCQGSN